MTSPTQLTPVVHKIFNEWDQHGITVGLERNYLESNADYKQRLLDVFVNRGGSTYRGMLNAITRELGLSFYDAMTVTMSSGLTNPAIVFDENLCKLMSDINPNNPVTYLEIDLADKTSDNYYLGGLIDTINATPYFSATISSEADEYDRSMRVYKQSNVTLVYSEELISGAKIKLDNENILANTVSIESDNLTQRVSSQADVNASGRYYINLETGTLYTYDSPMAGSLISYMYKTDPVTFKASPVIISNLQGDEYQKKLFYQATNELGVNFDSVPSIHGIDIISELYTLAGLYWGV